MANPFDQFDAPEKHVNPFDQFDQTEQHVNPFDRFDEPNTPGIGGVVNASISGAISGAASLGGGAGLAALGEASGLNTALPIAAGAAFPPAAIVTVPLTKAALVGGEWLIGGYLAGKAEKSLQKQIVPTEIQKEIEAHPTAESVASMAVQAPLIAKSMIGLAGLSGGERLAKLAGGFGVGAALEPARYVVESGLSQAGSAITGKPAEPVSPVTISSTFESGLFGAALAGLGEKGLTETAEALKQGEINATKKRIDEQNRQQEHQATQEGGVSTETSSSNQPVESGQEPKEVGRKIVSTAVEHEGKILTSNDPSASHAQIGEDPPAVAACREIERGRQSGRLHCP